MEALQGIGTSEVILRLLWNLHASTGAHVRIENVTSYRFVTSSGVYQGCVLVPALFNRAINWVTEHACCLGVKGIVVCGHVFTDLYYADNIALLSAN